MNIKILIVALVCLFGLGKSLRLINKQNHDTSYQFNANLVNKLNPLMNSLINSVSGPLSACQKWNFNAPNAQPANWDPVSIANFTVTYCSCVSYGMTSYGTSGLYDCDTAIAAANQNVEPPVSSWWSLAVWCQSMQFKNYGPIATQQNWQCTCNNQWPDFNIQQYPCQTDAPPITIPASLNFSYTSPGSITADQQQAWQFCNSVNNIYGNQYQTWLTTQVWTGTQVQQLQAQYCQCYQSWPTLFNQSWWLNDYGQSFFVVSCPAPTPVTPVKPVIPVIPVQTSSNTCSKLGSQYGFPQGTGCCCLNNAKHKYGNSSDFTCSAALIQCAPANQCSYLGNPWGFGNGQFVGTGINTKWVAAATGCCCAKPNHVAGTGNILDFTCSATVTAC